MNGTKRASTTTDKLAGYLESLPANTAENPHTVVLTVVLTEVLAATVTINTIDTNPNGVWASINRTVQAAGKYVIMDISACTAAGNTIEGNSSPTNNHFNIIKDNAYIKGIILPDTLTSIGWDAFAGCRGLTGVIITGNTVTSTVGQAFSSLTYRRQRSCRCSHGLRLFCLGLTVLGDVRGCNIMENGLLEYGAFIKEIKELIYRRQYEAMKKVNAELIQLYWEIGGEIDRQQREKDWGKSVVEVLAIVIMITISTCSYFTGGFVV